VFISWKDYHVVYLSRERGGGGEGGLFKIKISLSAYMSHGVIFIGFIVPERSFASLF